MGKIVLLSFTHNGLYRTFAQYDKVDILCSHSTSTSPFPPSGANFRINSYAMFINSSLTAMMPFIETTPGK